MKFRAPLLFVLGLVLGTPVWANAPDCACARTAAVPAPGSADAKFAAIYSAEWTWRQQQFPGGDDDSATAPVPDRLPRVDAKSQQARLQYWNAVLKKLAAIPVGKLSPASRIDYEVYKPQIENLAADVRFRQYEMPFNSDSQFWSDLGFMSGRRLRTVKDAENYIALLNDVPRWFDENIVNMRAGLKRGFSVPRAVLAGRDVSISTYMNVKSPQDSDFYKPFKSLPATIPVDEQAKLQAECAAAIRDKVIPAYAKLLKFFDDEYVPGARSTLAAEALPDGRAYYRQQIREYTTLDLDPDAIHRIGLKEVDRIGKEMNATMKATGFTGDMPAFLHFLRTDPRFYAKTPDELLMHAAWIAKRVDGKLAQYFGKLPRGRFGIEPVPAAIAPFWTAGRGGPHTYWVNTYDLPARPLYNLTALTLHESAPGHALQGELVEEMQGVPDFRKVYISAYGEGWALYCEYLGKEMGIYRTPYDDFGRESYDMWRAARLVIDTGLHHLGWTRAQAITYLADHTALSEHEVETEVDRYISWPGQALSYKLGELKILELRQLAESELGAKFDIRKFHDAVLETGSVPLPVLEDHIKAFIAEQRKTNAG
ncbi:MAG: DUF885 family protein [Xanthomonadaceae bacterium]|nr:DUF885 family protein [Xanthomonadaceae bacterium]MDE1884636.1 DUF885 family protein [Xanthomonadaceae bacterium]MDE1960515.1 DUF885 family protein [Xanthomonadaceae bacterium]MDE2083524.1 DUF885 family protein [Xanthomonadaceae bacterium]